MDTAERRGLAHPRNPDLLPQDVSLWPSSAVQLARGVPAHEWWLLRSWDPEMREMLAADQSCSEATMCLLAGDVAPVQLALAGNGNLFRRARDMLAAAAMADRCGPRHSQLVIKTMVGNPAADLDPWANPRHGRSRIYRYLAEQCLADPACEVDLLRALWRVHEIRPLVAVHPRLPDDMVLRAATISPRRGGTAIRAAIAQRGWDGGAVDWPQVRSFAEVLDSDQRERLFAVLPPRFLAEAASDGQAEVRAAAAATVRHPAALRRLARDPDGAVRRRAARRLLDLVVGEPG